MEIGVHVGSVSFDQIFDLHDDNLLITFVRFENKRLGNFTGLHIVDNSADVLRQLFVLEAGGTIKIALLELIDHKSLIVARIVIFRVLDNGFFKGQLIFFYQGVQAIQLVCSFRQGSIRYFGFEYDLSEIDHIASFLYELNDMIAVVGFNDGGNTLRISK